MEDQISNAKTDNDELTTKQFADAVGLTVPRICQMIGNGEIVARRFGSQWAIGTDQILVVKNRTERRGRPSKRSRLAANGI